MTRDEAAHGAKAQSLGADDLPMYMKLTMRLTSKLMTHGSYWL
jgi:hypothetical protein